MTQFKTQPVSINDNQLLGISGTITLESFPMGQRGASVSSIAYFILSLGIFAKLGIAVVPAQIGDYQFEKAVATQLKKANDNKESAKDFMKELNKQLSINADYNTKPEEMLTFTSERKGQLAVHKDYEVVNNFFGNVDIVNRFEGDILAEGIAD